MRDWIDDNQRISEDSGGFPSITAADSGISLPLRPDAEKSQKITKNIDITLGYAIVMGLSHLTNRFTALSTDLHRPILADRKKTFCGWRNEGCEVGHGEPTHYRKGGCIDGKQQYHIASRHQGCVRRSARFKGHRPRYPR